MTKDVIVEAENTEIKRSSGFGRKVKSLSHPNVSKARQKYQISPLPHLTLYPVEKKLYIAGF